MSRRHEKLIARAREYLSYSPMAYHIARKAFHVLRGLRRRSNSGVRARAPASFQPRVSAIVPSYNHARYLKERIDSILNQTRPVSEIIILDDASTDDSVRIIQAYKERHPDLVKVALNETNSGRIADQWRKGVELATGDLLWICESDDFCRNDFLEALVPMFWDQAVMIAFGRIQFANEDGSPRPGLDDYRDNAEPKLWSRRVARPASSWFNGGFGVSNLIPNVGGCLIRNQPMSGAFWNEARSYRILGDWLLYLRLSRGGKIAYSPDAVSYFRQHGANCSVKGFLTSAYYSEHQSIIRAIRAEWGTPDAVVRRFHAGIMSQFDYARGFGATPDLAAGVNLDDALAVRRTGQHYLLIILGFYLGGGELFPICLANEMARRGLMVSILAMEDADADPQVRARLDPRVPVYGGTEARSKGAAAFVREIGATVVHSHHISGEYLFFADGAPRQGYSYVVTTHGSYETVPLPYHLLGRFAAGVSHWVYLTPRNLRHFNDATRRHIRASHIPNGMPADARPFPHTRADLGIGPDDVVFTVVSRAIPEKGWRQAIQALQTARERTSRRLVLLLAGSGPEADDLRAAYQDDPAIRLLGFQDHVHGLYRLSDCALLPTRFEGESFPLTLIQAMQTGTPIIATDMGEIRNMVEQRDGRAGLIVPVSRDDGRFIADLADAMVAMTDDAARARFADGASVLGRAYDMERVLDRYLACYESADAVPLLAAAQ